MTLQFQKATKEQARLRLAIFGPSGSGKTYTSLRMATGLGGSVAFIDTERGSASKYADRFEFDVLELPKKDIGTYCQAITAAQKAGYDVLVIDSLTHAWHELLSEVDKLAMSKYRGNTWSAWSEGTPKQRQLVDAILDFGGHIIATMRTKTEWTVQEAGNGKTRPVRVGLAPEQGKGIEYEFDLLMELSPDHTATVIKDRTGKYQDDTIEKPGEDFGQELAAWLKEGAEPTQRKPRKAEEPQPESGTNGSNGKKAQRPYDPEMLKAGLEAQVKKYRGKSEVSDEQRKFALALLNKVTLNSDSDRHSITLYLFGKESSKELTAAECSAIIKWVGAEEPDYEPNAHAIEEAKQVVKAYQVAQGQQELPLEA